MQKRLRGAAPRERLSRRPARQSRASSRAGSRGTRWRACWPWAQATRCCIASSSASSRCAGAGPPPPRQRAPPPPGGGGPLSAQQLAHREIERWHDTLPTKSPPPLPPHDALSLSLSVSLPCSPSLSTLSHSSTLFFLHTPPRTRYPISLRTMKRHTHEKLPLSPGPIPSPSPPPSPRCSLSSWLAACHQPLDAGSQSTLDHSTFKRTQFGFRPSLPALAIRSDSERYREATERYQERLHGEPFDPPPHGGLFGVTARPARRPDLAASRLGCRKSMPETADARIQARARKGTHRHTIPQSTARTRANAQS